MIDAAAEPPSPEIVAPAAHQVSFGRVVVRVPEGTQRVRLFVNNKLVVEKRARGRRVTMRVRLPRQEVSLRALSIDRGRTRKSSPAVGPVLGLRTGAFAGMRGWHDKRLARRLRRVARSFSGIAAYCSPSRPIPVD